MHFIPTLQDLSDHVKLDEIYVADSVLKEDQHITEQRQHGSRNKHRGTEQGTSGGGSEPEAATGGQSPQLTKGDSLPEESSQAADKVSKEAEGTA